MPKEFTLASLKPTIPASRVILPIALVLASHGTVGAVTNQGAAVWDLEQDASTYHTGKLRWEIKTVNGQGGTPTSPGAAATFTLKYAFLGELLGTVADATTVLAGNTTSVVCTLPNSTSAAAAGTKYHVTVPFDYAGRYLYLWYDRDAFAANALINLTAKLFRI